MPAALVQVALPSASMTILSPTFRSLPQASMTKGSLTATQAMVSTPLALSASALPRKLGMCFSPQVGVKAPGTPNSTTVLPPRSSSLVIPAGPSAVTLVRSTAGSLSPTEIVMVHSL